MDRLHHDPMNFRIDRFRHEAELHRLARSARPLPRRSNLVRRLSRTLTSR